jgi:hypothetical protein
MASLRTTRRVRTSDASLDAGSQDPIPSCALGDTAPDLAGAPLRMELEAADTFPEGLGEQRRDEAMNQAPDSRRRMSVPPPSAPGDVTEYVFHNISHRAMAYYFKGLDGGVFVDCSEQPHCRAPAAKQPNHAAPERPVFEPSARNSD